eukprot:TRINITY_DN18779_c0_g1_i1.p1 TRINITY_DN18779_c0_g1~~TRINITY_DN18779_c0_g1_i1.p1  ORF type:complete len:153 (-),score=29.84 TRINITY_DN18779_c0_g1_i1:92-550(-)
MADPVNQVEQGVSFLKVLQESGSSDYGGALLSKCTDISGAHGEMRTKMVVSSEEANLFGTLHGGAIATLVDIISTAALLTLSDRPGVSVDLNVSYVTAAPVGEEVEIVGKVLKAGKSVAMTTVDIVLVKSGKLVASGRHTKFTGGGTPQARL